MTKTCRLYLIRHAPVREIEGYVPEKNPKAVINSDHLKKLAKHIPNNSLCYVSPLKRAVQTANELSKYINLREIIIAKELREQNFGEWQGKKISLVWEEIKKLKTQHNFSFICPDTCPPKGDSFLDQCKRVSEFVDNINFDNHTSLIFISHSGTIRAFLSHFLNLDPNNAISIEISHLSITSIEVLIKDNLGYKGGKYRLLNVNNQII